MKFATYILGHRHAVWALVLATLYFGVAAYFSLPVQLFPDTDPPVVKVLTPYPGVSAPDVALELSRPMEEEFTSLEGIVRVGSSSEDNLSVIDLEFDYHRDAEMAAVETQNAIARIAAELPEGIGEPQVLSMEGGDGAVVTFGVVGDDLVEARRYAEDVAGPRLRRLEGVAAVDVFGGGREAVVVETDEARLAAHGVSIEQVVRELVRQNATQPAGRVRTERRDTLFRVEARPGSVEELSRTPISLADGTRILLSDVATVRSGHLDDEAGVSIDARDAVAMQVFETTEANTVEVVRSAEVLAAQLSEELEATHGGGLEIVIGDESASFTETSIANLLTNVVQAIFLAAMVMLLFLGRLRASLVAAVSMPLSYGLTFVGMYLLGVEFNMVTLSAVILAVGMVVDASVVVLENIVRLRDQGMSAEQAAAQGTAEVAGPVMVGMLSTAAVLVPLLFVPGFVGATFGPLAMTLLVAFVSSVIVALTVVPVLTLYLESDTASQRGVGTRALSVLVRPFQAVMDGVRGVFLALLSMALRRRWITVMVAVGSFVAGVAGIQAQGMEVLPRMDGGSFYISYETRSGSSLEATQGVARQLEAQLMEQPEVVKVQSQTGYEMGMRSLSATGAQGPTQGFITVELSPRTQRETTIWEVQDRIRESIAAIPEVEASVVRELGNTAKSTTDAPVGVRISGEDPLVLDRIAEEVIAELEEVEGVVDPVRGWRLDRHRLRVEVDALRAAAVGLSPLEVGVQMQAGSQGLDGGLYYGGRETGVPVVVRNKQRDRPSDLLAFPVRVPDTGESVPLRSVAKLSDETGPAVVSRENLRQTLEISAQTGERPLSFVMNDVEEAMNGVTVPAGYRLEVTGERSDLAEARSGLMGALGVAIAAVYLLLLMQLRSFVRPVVIMMSVPLSLVGVAAALWLTQRAVSMPVMVGLILLVGIVVNNAIILLDVVRRRREEGMERRQALRAGVEVRFRPIMMTALSTVVGMIPLAAAWALGAERFSPLAIAVMGGLIASTLLTMVVIPVVYDLMESGVERLRQCWGGIGR